MKTSWTMLLLALVMPGDCCNMYNDYCDYAEDGEDGESEARERREVLPAWEKGSLAKTVSLTLDQLFVGSGYDKRLRPGEGGEATQVEVNMAIRSMGPVDETKEKFTLDCYFRQSWTDPRLAFNKTHLRELAMNWQFLSTIWRPDTYFMNGKDSYLHKIAVPNR